MSEHEERSDLPSGLNLSLMLVDRQVPTWIRLSAINSLMPRVDTQKELDELYPGMVVGALQNKSYVHDYAEIVRDSMHLINSGIVTDVASLSSN